MSITEPAGAADRIPERGRPKRPGCPGAVG
jgi:hypothetical protein